jgi:predicted MFS family arabinose efflux permease
MKQLLLNRAFARFWFAGFFFLLATWALHATMLIYVFELTGSPFATGLIPVFASIPGILLGPVAGVLVDRWNRKRIMTGSALVLAVLLILAMPFGSHLGASALFAIIFIEAIVMTFFSPAENAILPTLVDHDDLAAANARNALNDSLARIAGPAIGAGIFVAYGFTATLGVCAVLYLAGWAVLAGLHYLEPDVGRSAAASDPGIGPMLQSVWWQLIEGVRTVRGHRPLLVAVSVFALFMMADVPLSAVLPAFMIDSVGVSPDVFGTLMSVRGVTGLLGGLLVVMLSRRVNEAHLLVGGLLLHGASVLAFGLSNNLLGSVLILIPIGPAAAAIQTGLFTMLQKGSAPAMRGRVFALVGTLNGIITILVSLGAGALGEATSTRLVVILSGCLYVLPLMVLFAWFRTRTQPVTGGNPAPDNAMS